MQPLARSTELVDALAALRPYLRSAAWFSFVSAVLVLAPAAYMLEVYDRVVNSRNLATLLMLTLAVVGAFAVMALLDWARLRLLQQASFVLDRSLGERVLSAMFAGALRQRASTAAQAMADLRTVREFIPSPPVTAAMELPASLVFLLVLLALHPLLAAAAFGGALVHAAITWRNERETRPALREGHRAGALAARHAEGAQLAAQAVAAMGMQQQVQARWLQAQRESLAHQAEASRRGARWQASAKFVQVALGSLLLGLGVWLVVRNEMLHGAGMVVLASIVGARMLGPLVLLVAQWRQVVNAREAWGRLDQLLQEIPRRPPSMPLPPPRAELQVERATVCPPGAAVPVLKDVAFGLHPGEVLAVIGQSGAGKTCLARALVGLWPCESGKIRLDRADVFTWDKEELGRHLGYLPQEVELFEGTVAENIARFGDADPERVEAAARAAGLHEVIEALPEKYDTPVGPEGVRLSGGQRQRIALARALYGNPVLVVLDEPNASLDEAGDAALAAAVLALSARGTACVLITQRTGVLGLAHKVLVLHEGKMQAFGPRDEVLAALAKAAAEVARRAAGAVAPAQTEVAP
jgi:ATP-binding cassette subfamily C exporter for protease/lipase